MKWLLHLVLVAISAGSGYFGAKLETSYRDASRVAAATPDVAPTVGKSDEGVPTSPVSLVTLTPASPVTTVVREEAVDPASLPEVATAKELPTDPPALAVVVPMREAPVDPAVLPEVAVVKETPVDPATLPTVVATKEAAVAPPALPVVVAEKKEAAVAPPALPTVVAKVDPPAVEKKEPTMAPKVTEERITPPTVVVVPTAPAPAVVAKDEKKDAAKSVLVPAAPAKAEPQFRTEYRTVTETVYVQSTIEETVCLGRGRCETRYRTVMSPQTVTKQIAVQVPVNGSTAAPSGTVAGTTVVSAPAPTTVSTPVQCVPCGTAAVAPSYGSPYGSPGASYGCSTTGSYPQQGYSSCGSNGNSRIVHGQPLRNVARVVFHIGGNGGGFRNNGCNNGGLFSCR